MARILNHDDRHPHLAVARNLARLLDSAWTIPLINKKIGLDPVLGLVPGLGDLVSLIISLYILAVAYDLGVPRFQLLRMLINIGLDSAVGTIPVVGDFLDAGWKANIKNVQIIDKHLARQNPENNRAKRWKLFQWLGGAQPDPADQTIEVVAERHQTGKS
jgi:hypothetical protein